MGVTGTENLKNPGRLWSAMTTPMDRDFGDDPFRRMERKKAAARLGWPAEDEPEPDIEDPIIAERQ